MGPILVSASESLPESGSAGDPPEREGTHPVASVSDAVPVPPPRAPESTAEAREPLETQLVFAAILLFLVGASVGGAFGIWKLTERTEFVTFNILTKEVRGSLLKLMAASGAGL